MKPLHFAHGRLKVWVLFPGSNKNIKLEDEKSMQGLE